jgi:hypothetical protein
VTYRPAQLPGSVLSSSGLSPIGQSGSRLPASSWLAANADRERAVDVLRAGFAEGRLTQEEFNQRVARAYASRTYGELADLTADLPVGPMPPGAMPTGATPADFARPAAALDWPGPPAAALDWPGPPPAARPAPSFSSPAAIAGLVLTAVVVFTLAALITGAALYVHMHSGQHVFMQPGGPVNLLPKVTRLH